MTTDSSLISQKLRSKESVLFDFEVYRAAESSDGKNLDYLLTIVNSGPTYAIFVIKLATYPAKTLADLTIDGVFPIDNDFKFEIDQGVGISAFQLRISNRSQSEKFFYSPTTLTELENFRQTVDQIRGKFIPTAGNFEWLRYYQSKTNDVNVDKIEPPSREEKFKDELMRRQPEYTFTNHYKIFCGTFNVNCILPNDIYLKEWLSIVSEPPDIYAVAFQEIDMKPDTILFSETRPDRQWIEKIMDGVFSGVTYVELATVRFVGMQLTLVIKRELRPSIKQCHTAMVGTGTLKYGNKGGIGISIKLNESHICFINAHLAAHQNEYERRNEDFREIVRRMQFTEGIRQRSIYEHDHIFWLGDLNYRVNKDLPRTDNYIYKDLIYFDQLYNARLEEKIFVDFEEGDIQFRPTYKYDTGTDTFDSSEKMRAPAWCDRILWKGKNVVQHEYNSVMEIRFSDHKPVYATFTVPVLEIDPEKYKRVHEEALKSMDKFENDNQPMLTIAQTDIDFGQVKFNEMKTCELVIANNCRLPVRFEFMGKDGPGSRSCEPWIDISHPSGNLITGDSLSIQLTIFLDTNAASKMLKKIKDAKSGEKSPLEILVLHVEKGRDTFITLFGEYQPSSFGLSVETLVKLSKPVVEYQLQDLISIETKGNCANLIEIECTSNMMIPRQVWLLVDYLNKNGLKVKDLFTVARKYSKNNNNLNEIRDWLDSWSTAEFPGIPQTTAEALLMLFESTPEPLLKIADKDIINVCDNFDKCRALVINQVSPLRRRIFLYVCLFIRDLRRFYDINQMNDRNLALIFSRVFIRAPSVPINQTNASRQAFQQYQVVQEDRRRQFIQQFFSNDVQQWAENEFSMFSA